MSIKPDRWIRKMCIEHRMIEPFEEKQVREGVISYGVSSYGYDIRVADEFKIFTNVNSTVVDPKHVDPASMVDVRGAVCIVPPNSFALARTVEYFRIPRNVLTICVGKCLSGDTRVVDAETGEYVELRTFVARRASHAAGLKDWRMGARAVTEHLTTGVRPVYRVRTRAGLELKMTAEHPLRTFSRWARLCDLAIGDRIAVARSIPCFGREVLPEHEARLLGFMLSDGQCATPGHSPCYSTGDPVLARAFGRAARAFGCAVSRAGRYGYRLVNHRGRGGRPERNRMSVWLERHSCAVRSRDKRVPTVVFRSPRDGVVTFLRALFSGDGSIWRSGDGVQLEYATISRRLADDVRHLLLRFGIFGMIRERRSPDGYTSYRVQVTDRGMILRFGREIGFERGSRKQRALERAMAECIRVPKSKSNFDTLPPEAWGAMRTTVRASGRSLRSLGVAGTQPHQSLGLEVAQRVARELPETRWATICEADVVWDTIVSIEPAGEEEVFDLTVPAGSNFVANDFVAHNSTYARCGIITNVTPFEPEWEGFVTLEISNTTPLPAKIYANEGIAQVLFFESDEPCETSYRDKAGKYQKQVGITLPRL